MLSAGQTADFYYYKFTQKLNAANVEYSVLPSHYERCIGFLNEHIVCFGENSVTLHTTVNGEKKTFTETYLLFWELEEWLDDKLTKLNQ